LDASEGRQGRPDRGNLAAAPHKIATSVRSRPGKIKQARRRRRVSTMVEVNEISR
jgi:hypothetical protein